MRRVPQVMTCDVRKLLEFGIRSVENPGSAYELFIAHDFCAADETGLLIVERIHEAIRKELTSVFVTVPANVSCTSSLVRLPHISDSHISMACSFPRA